MSEKGIATKFTGNTGRRPSAEARRYVYRVLASCLDDDLDNPEGWVLGGIDDEPSQRRARKAAKLVFAELVRKGRR